MEIALEEWIVLVGVLMPFVTAVAAKISTPEWWKGLMSISFAAIAGIINQMFSPGFDWSVAFSDGFAVWGMHVITWVGVSSTAVAKLHDYTATKGLPVPSFLNTSLNTSLNTR